MIRFVCPGCVCVSSLNSRSGSHRFILRATDVTGHVDSPEFSSQDGAGQGQSLPI